MNRATSIILLFGAYVAILNSNAHATDLDCNQSAVVSGSAQVKAAADSEQQCAAVCQLYNYKPEAQPVEPVKCNPYKYDCVPVVREKTLKNVEPRFTPPSAPGAAQEQPGLQPQGQCDCNANLDLKVACVPSWEAPPPQARPVDQSSAVTCCAYEIPPTSERPGFLGRLSQGALTVGAYTREGIQVAAICSDGTTYGALFDSDMSADRYRIEWYHWHGFIGWIERNGFEPLEGATGFGGGFCWTF